MQENSGSRKGKKRDEKRINDDVSVAANKRRIKQNNGENGKIIKSMLEQSSYKHDVKGKLIKLKEWRRSGSSTAE